jgi:hypothetical protein
MTTYDPAARLNEARLRQQQLQKSIEELAVNSVTAWLSTIVRRIVGPAVRSVLSWFARLFR